MKTRLSLTVNGESHDVLVGRAQDAARGAARGPGLTGTKHGCELGECGACAVLVDGEPVLSCLVLPVECEGARDRRPSRAWPTGGGCIRCRQAFADLGAAQCGYCTPGILLTAKALLDGEPEPDARARSGGARRQPLPLHRLHARSSKRSSWPPRRTRGARREAGAMSSRATARRSSASRCRKVDALGQGHRPDALRRRPRAAAHAALQAAALDRTRTRASSHRHRTRAARCPASTLVAHRRATSRSRSASCRSPGRARALRSTRSASSAIRSRRSPRSTRRRPSEALDLIDVEYEPLPRRSSDPRRRSPSPSRASTTTATAATSTRRSSLQFGDVDEALRRAPTTSSRTCSSSRATRTCRSSSTPRSRTCDPDGKLTLWSSTQTPHYLHRALAKVLRDAGRAHPRHRHARTAAASAARAIRSTTRSSSRKAGAAARPAGEDLPDARGGLLLPPRPPSGADAVQDRRDEGRHDHRHAPADAARRRRLRLATAWRRTFYTGALQTVTYQIPRYQLRRLPRLHQQAAVRPQARPRHAAAALRPGGAARQDRRDARASIPAELRLRHRRAARHADRELPARRHDRPRPSASSAWSQRSRLARASCGKLPHGPRPRPRLLVVPLRRRAADLLERHAALRRAAEARSQRRRHRRSAARPRSARARTTCSAYVVAEVLGLSPWTSACTGDTDLTPVDLGSYSSRVTLMAATPPSRRRPGARADRPCRGDQAGRRAGGARVPRAPGRHHDAAPSREPNRAAVR